MTKTAHLLAYIFFITLSMLLSLLSPHALARNPFEFAEADTPNLTLSATPLTNLFIPVHYADPQHIADFINKTTHDILSKKGTIAVDTRTSQLWIHDNTTHINKIKSLIKQLDVAVPQILIKTRLVTVDDNYLQSLGSSFYQNTNTTTTSSQSPMDIINQIPIVKLGNNTTLNMQLNALSETGHASIIAEPKLFTMNHQTAHIESGEDIPYQQATSSGATSVAFKKAVLALSVTPDILPNAKIRLHIKVNQDTVSSLSVNGVPAINTQHLTTQVMLNNKETVILGGIINHTVVDQKTGVPLLKDIPLFSLLFSHTEHHTKKTQLLLLVTPIITPAL